MRTTLVVHILIYAVLTCSVVITFWGLFSQVWPEIIPWAGPAALKRFLVIISAFAVTILLLARVYRANPILIGGVVIIVMALLVGVIWPLIYLAWFALASVCVGEYVLNKLGMRFGLDDLADYFLVGAGIYGITIGLLAHFPVNYLGVYGLLLACPLVLRRWLILGIIGRMVARVHSIEVTSIWSELLAVGVAVISCVYFVVALFPEIGYDALAQHLFVASQLKLRHEWGFDPSLYAMALIPMLADWLYSLAYVMAGELGARFTNLGFTFLLAWQGYKIVLWAGGKEFGGLWAALLFLTTPLVFAEISSLHVESVWAVFIVAGTVAILRLTIEPRKGDGVELRYVGLLIGFAAATKATTLPVLIVFLPMILLRWNLWVSRQGRSIFVSAVLIFLLVGAIPYLTAWIIAGNPVFPFFNQYFDSPHFPPVNFTNTLFLSGVSWDLLYRITFSSKHYLESTNGAAGFQWLLLLPSSLIIFIFKLNIRALGLFVVSLGSIIILFYSQSYLRYIYPYFLILTALLGVSFHTPGIFPMVVPRSLCLIATITLSLNLLFLTSANWSYRYLPVEILFSNEIREQFLDTRNPVSRAVRLVNQINIDKDPVAFFSEPFGAGLDADALYANWYNHKFRDAVLRAQSGRDMSDLLRLYDSKYVLVDDRWKTTEIRQFIEESTRFVAKFGKVSVRVVLESRD